MVERRRPILPYRPTPGLYVIAAALAMAAACTSGPVESDATVAMPDVDLVAPGGFDPVPLVVMIPGGGWQTSDPDGLRPLASALGERGVAAATVSIRAADDGVVFPVPLVDVRCAVSLAVARLAEERSPPLRIIVLGHSSGAHLAALAALTPDAFPAECSVPTDDADALIGLAGPYDVSTAVDRARTLFGSTPETDPEAWRRGNPVEQAGSRREVPVLLLHGDADEVVTISYTNGFAQALRRGGHEVTVEIVPGADHDSIYAPDTIGEVVAGWVTSLDPAN